MQNEKKQNNRWTSTRTLAENAILIAVATVLSLFAVFKLPNGGSVTIGSMIPIILLSIKYPLRWSLTAAFAYSLIQMLSGFFAPPVENILYYTIMILLDYIIAFCVLCLSGPIYRKISSRMSARFSIITAAIICFILRFISHFLSGIIIWGYYASEGQPVWLYSLLYNGSYMICECLISGTILYFAGQRLVALMCSNNSV